METLSQPLTADPAEFRLEMMKRLDTLRKNERYGDVTVVVQGKEFAAHKVVLSAASPFFFTLLESNMKETKEERISVTLEETTTSVMEDVLEYIYTGNVTVTEESFPYNLIATADYLLMPSLKTLSGRFLQECLAIENCISTFYFAEKYRCEELQAKSLEFINSNFTAVMATEGFLSLNSKQVKELISSDDIIVNTEEEVFKAILNWVSTNRSKREGEFAGLFRQIRLISVSRDYLLNEMVKEELVTQNNECLKVVLEAVKCNANVTEDNVPQPPRKCLETRTDAVLASGGTKMLCYLPEEKRWYQLADSLFEHENHTVTQYRDRVYIVGGDCNSMNVTEYYLPSTNTWKAIGGKSLEITCSSVTVLKGSLYAASDLNASIYKYYHKVYSWQEIADPPTRRKGACAVAYGKHLYLMGGSRVGPDGEIVTATTERFDPDENSWEEVAAMSEARSIAFGVALNKKIYVAGGLNNTDMLLSSEVYNPVTNDWQLIASLQEPRGWGSMVCFKGALYVLGGSDSQSRELLVEVYDPDRNEWRKETDIPISCGTEEEREKEIPYTACVARISKNVISDLEPLNN